MKIKNTLITLAATGLLSACGGGGGGGGTASGPAAPISASNQTAVAQDVMESAEMLSASASMSPVAGAIAVDERVLMRVARAQLEKMPGYVANAPKAAAGAVDSQTYACTSGGTVTVSINDADNSFSWSAGDIGTLAFNACTDGTATINGSLSFTFNALTGVVGAFPVSAQMTMAFGNFTVSGSGYSIGANGSVTVSDTVTGVNNFSETITVPSLSTWATLAGATRTRTLTNYVTTFTRVPDITYLHIDSRTVSGTISGSTPQATVTVTVATPVAMTRRGTDLYPYLGQVILTGQNSSKLRITAVDSATVELALDADGNGSYEATSTVPWSSLFN